MGLSYVGLCCSIGSLLGGFVSGGFVVSSLCV